MPHIRLDTTADLPENADIPEILAELVAELARHETIDPAAIKAYHTLRSCWVMGVGAPAGFVHCEVALLSGRSVGLRHDIAVGITDVLRKRFAGSLDAHDAGLTVEVREMNSEAFVKQID